jgi:hypothetical protein
MIRLLQTDAGLVGQIGESEISSVNRSTSVPGIYELWYREMDSSTSVDRTALNVDPDEGDLRVVEDEKLIQYFGESTSLNSWDQFSPEPKQKSISSLNRLFFVLFIVTLIVEQSLAWMCSYH